MRRLVEVLRAAKTTRPYIHEKDRVSAQGRSFFAFTQRLVTRSATDYGVWISGKEEETSGGTLWTLRIDYPGSDREASSLMSRLGSSIEEGHPGVRLGDLYQEKKPSTWLLRFQLVNLSVDKLSERGNA